MILKGQACLKAAQANCLQSKCDGQTTNAGDCSPCRTVEMRAKTAWERDELASAHSFMLRGSNRKDPLDLVGDCFRLRRALRNS